MEHGFPNLGVYVDQEGDRDSFKLIIFINNFN